MTPLALGGSDPAAAAADDLVDANAALVGHRDYPCLGARSVFRRERATVRVYAELGRCESAEHLLQDLQEFANVVQAVQGHPLASRDARRAVTPTLAFNLHEQFEALRASGRFPRMRDRIRQRDEHLQGFVNPMVAKLRRRLRSVAVLRPMRGQRLAGPLRGPDGHTHRTHRPQGPHRPHLPSFLGVLVGYSPQT